MNPNEVHIYFILMPLLAMGFILFGLAASACFAAWVYSDSRRRGEDGALWAVIVFVATPLIGLLIYFLKRSEVKRPCHACGHKISCSANYCESCGAPADRNEIPETAGQSGRFRLILLGITGSVLTIACLTGFIIGIALSPTTISSPGGTLWNKGYTIMKYQTHLNGVWKLNLLKASKGYVASSYFDLDDPSSQLLYADIQCGSIPEGASLTLRITQGELSSSTVIAKDPAGSPLLLPLTGFESGEIRAELEINGVENIKSEIYIR